jgi:methionyl aminopeptidase
LIHLKSPREIDRMRQAGRLLASVLMKIVALIKPGEITGDIDACAERLIIDAGGKPAFKGYKGRGKRRFPATLCMSIDSEIVHGIPSARRLENGQIVGVDAGVELDGWYADMAGSFLVGIVDAEKRKLWSVTREALYRGIAKMRPGNRLSEVGTAIQDWVESNGYHVIKDLVGHGIGTQLHEDPAVPNYRFNRGDIVLQPGMTLAVEPMVSTGSWKIRVLPDGWTAVTIDDSPTAHFEHTVLITEGEPEILTLLEDKRDPWLLLDNQAR